MTTALSGNVNRKVSKGRKNRKNVYGRPLYFSIPAALTKKHAQKNCYPSKDAKSLCKQQKIICPQNFHKKRLQLPKLCDNTSMPPLNSADDGELFIDTIIGNSIIFERQFPRQSSSRSLLTTASTLDNNNSSRSPFACYATIATNDETDSKDKSASSPLPTLEPKIKELEAGHVSGLTVGVGDDDDCSEGDSSTSPSSSGWSFGRHAVPKEDGGGFDLVVPPQAKHLTKKNSDGKPEEEIFVLLKKREKRRNQSLTAGAVGGMVTFGVVLGPAGILLGATVGSLATQLLVRTGEHHTQQRREQKSFQEFASVKAEHWNDTESVVFA